MQIVVEIDITGTIRVKPLKPKNRANITQKIQIETEQDNHNEKETFQENETKLLITITARDYSTGKSFADEQSCSIPLPPENLRAKNSDWRKEYSRWFKGIATLIESPPHETDKSPTISVSQQCQKIGRESISDFNEWISYQNEIRSALLSVIPSSVYKQNPHYFRFILRTRTGDPDLDLELQRFPYHTWDFLRKFYPHAEIALNMNNRSLSEVVSHQRPRILVILGYDPKIAFIPYQESIGENISRDLADVQYWSCRPGNPNTGKYSQEPIPDLFATLRASSPQVVIFIGHSKSTQLSSPDESVHNASVEIRLNEHDSISLEDRNVQEILRGLGTRGTIFAAFISCDGQRIAPIVNNLGIPCVMVSLEILPVHIAKILLDKFLEEATKPGVPIHIALSYARQHLQDTVEHSRIEGCPNASNFPAMFQIPDRHSYILNPILEPIVEIKETIPLSIWQKEIERIKKFAKSSNGKFFAFITLFAISAFVLTQIFIKPDLAIVPDRIRANMDISLGDKELIKYNEPKLQEGFNNFRDGYYELAISAFEEYLSKNKYSPEISIAKNNAKAALIANKNNQNPIRIAAGVPLLSNIPVAKEILAGIAMYQEKVIQDNISLQIAIGRDSNVKESAEAIANQLVLESSISGAIGHNASAASIAAAKIYNNKRLVMISPTSFDNNKLAKINYAYKMVSQMEYFASELKKYIGNSLKGNHRIAICLDAKSTDNEIFTKLFLDKLDFDKFQRLDCGNFESIDKKTIDRMIKEVKTGGGNYKTIGLLISPHIDAIPQAMSILTAVKKELGSDFQLFGAPSLYTHDTAEKATAETTGLIIPVPYFPSSGNEFVNQYKSQWGKKLNNWRTPMAYASTKAMIESIRKIGNINSLYRRERLNEYLQNTKEFSADNVIEKFTFGSENHTLQYVNPSSSLGALIKLKKNGEFELIKRFAGTSNK